MIRIQRLVFLAVLFAWTPAFAQTTFTVENHGPTIGVPDAFSVFPITEGDILTPATAPAFGPNPPALAAPAPPGILISAGFGPPGPGLGLAAHAGCAGHIGGTPCPVEVDALSYGFDLPVPMGPLPPGTFWFSVDEYAVGIAGLPVPPTIDTEAAAFGNFEAAGDAFVDLGIPGLGPYPPLAFPPMHTGAIDGNGLPNFIPGFASPGLGIVEPNPPIIMPPDIGDNLDGMDVDGFFPAVVFPAFYSLDGPFVDPLNGFPWNGSAAAIGFSGADVLVTPAPGGPPAVYAPAAALGLDFFGFNTDDLDALILAENGMPGYQPSMFPYDWLGGATDMLLFSVRRGSLLIGAPDGFFGIPIEEGDILTTPLAGGAPFPGIFMAAENLGLATVRSGFAVGFGDELDALDAVPVALFDCNANGLEDAADIALGASADTNLNGIPDECEFTDCNGNGIPDAVDIATGTSADCNLNGVPDECDIAAGTSLDCNLNGIPDECEPDCNVNGIADACDIATGTSLDCNMNGIPDECDIAAGTSTDCNGNGIPDECEPPVDCNGNGVFDACDIADGTSSDVNGNGVPDDCELIAALYCFGVGCPCANDDPAAGCVSGTGSGSGAALAAAGTGSVTSDDLVLTTTGLPANNFGLVYMGTTQISTAFGNGLRCVGGAIQRYPIQNTGTGSIVLGPGTVSFSCTSFAIPFCITAVSTWNFQTWYRDPGGPCGSSFNFSNAVSVTFTP